MCAAPAMHNVKEMEGERLENIDETHYKEYHNLLYLKRTYSYRKYGFPEMVWSIKYDENGVTVCMCSSCVQYQYAHQSCR